MWKLHEDIVKDTAPKYWMFKRQTLKEWMERDWL